MLIVVTRQQGSPVETIGLKTLLEQEAFIKDMSDSQALTEFNFVVDVQCDELDNLDPANIYDVKIGNTKTKVIQNLKNRISELIVKNIESVGSVHLTKGKFDSSNSRQKSTFKAVHFGGSKGKLTGIPEESLVRFRLGIANLVDYESTVGKKEFEKKLDRIHGKILAYLQGNYIAIDSVSDIHGSLLVRGPTNPLYNFDWDAPDTNYQREERQTSNVEKSTEPVWEKTVNSLTAPGFESGAHKESAMTPAGRSADVNPEAPFENFDPISDAVEAAETHASSVKARKPKHDEIEAVTEAIFQRVKDLFRSEEPVYFDEIPDEWKNATCSRSDCEQDVEAWIEQENPDTLERFRYKCKKMIQKRLNQDFSLGLDDRAPSRKFKSSMSTNFLVTENANILIRPEEIISLVVSISNHTEPYCTRCHNEILGNNHEGFGNRLVILDENRKLLRADEDGNTDTEESETQTTIGSSEEPEDIGSSEEYEEVHNKNVSLERIDIEKEIDISDTEFTSSYRSLTSKERTRIDSSITKHLKLLATRVMKDTTEANAVYQTLFDRDFAEEYRQKGHLSCSTCKSPVVKPDADSNLRSFEKHHVEPLSHNRISAIIDKIRNLLNRSVGTDPEIAPVTVSEGGDRYLFADEFLSLLEMLYRNVDTLAFFCENCEETLQDPENDIRYGADQSEDPLDDESDGGSNGGNQRIFDFSYDVSNRRTVQFKCLGCRRRNSNTESIYTATVTGDKCYVRQDGKRCAVPVYTESFLSEQLPIGVCPKHKRQAAQSIDESTIHDEKESRREKLGMLIRQFHSLF